MGTPATPMEPPTLVMSAFMPRPGQSGALDVFNGDNASDFLENFNTECRLYGVKEGDRGPRLPYYCTPEVKEIVKILPGYDPPDWTKLQDEIKSFYWQYDHPKNTPAALNALIRDSAKFSLAAYVLKFTSITNALVAKNVMSSVERINKLLEGLDEMMRIKVIELCTSKGWRITDQDGGGEPKFPEIAKYFEDKARSVERVSVYDKEHTMRGSSAPNSTISYTSTAVNLPKPTPVDPAVKELTDQLAALALVVKGLSSEKQTTGITTSATPAAAPPRPERIPRCIWCDSRDHFRVLNVRFSAKL
jgi:hypothetical protein